MRKSSIALGGAILVVAVAGTILLSARPAQAAPSFEGMPLTVYKSPSCGCCGDYVAILRQRGAVVTVVDTEDTASHKQRLGVPAGAWSCHTTVIEGYAVEGHVPLEAVERLLAGRPRVAGTALPGMPLGSPGMTGLKAAPFEVVTFGAGVVSDFGAY